MLERLETIEIQIAGMVDVTKRTIKSMEDDADTPMMRVNYETKILQKLQGVLDALRKEIPS